MKKIFLILSVQFLILKVLAQDSLNLEKYYPKPKITSIEFLVGPSLVSVRGGDERIARPTGGGGYFVSSLNNKAAYSFGIGLNHKFSKHFVLNARLFWERKGYIENLDSITLNTSATSIATVSSIRSEDVKNNYLTISILPQFTFGKKAHFNIGAGGYVSSLISSYTQVDQPTQPTFSYPSDQAYNKYDLGLSLNAGFSYPIKANFDIILQLNANYGLHQISDWFTSFNYPSWYNNSYSILVGMRFVCKNVFSKVLRQLL
jgi:hypothetical protein